MEKHQLKHIAELALIGGMARLKLGEGVKRGRLKSQLRKLEKAVDKDLQKCIEIDQGDIDMIWNIVDKFTRDAGWKTKTLKTVTLTQFCKALIAQYDEPVSLKSTGSFQSDKLFSTRVQNILDDIEDYYDRAGKLKPINIWPADLACKKWRAIWGIHEEDGPDSLDRLQAIDEQIARDHALDEYQARFYPETVRAAS